MKVLFIATLFCLWCTLITVHAQLYSFGDGTEDDETGDASVDCPADLLKLYDRCRGDIDPCSTCLGQAERECEKADSSGICFRCTTSANGNCNNGNELCFGDSLCKRDEQCVNFKCVKT